MRRFADYLEDIDGVEILSLGSALELIKDLGDATTVANQYKLKGFRGSHAIGHTRMATESDVDIRSAHPYWAYPFHDISVVHNGQLTNYWNGRRALERKGRHHRARAVVRPRGRLAQPRRHVRDPQRAAPRDRYLRSL